MTKIGVGILLIRFTLVLILIAVNMYSTHIYGVKFTPVPANNVPIAKINPYNGEYQLESDFSIDYGDETVIEQNFDAKSVENMTLDKKVNGSSLELVCDSDDECGTSLAPISISIYLVDVHVNDIEIPNNSVTKLELGNNDCDTKSIKDCANFNFTVPNHTQFQNYKIVIDMSFDEARWIFVNPIKILK